MVRVWPYVVLNLIVDCVVRTYVTQRVSYTVWPSVSAGCSLFSNFRSAFKSEAITNFKFLCRGTMVRPEHISAQVHRECHRSRAWHDECKRNVTMSIYTSTNVALFQYTATMRQWRRLWSTREGHKKQPLYYASKLSFFCCMLLLPEASKGLLKR
jgi:hypothetical protein